MRQGKSTPGERIAKDIKRKTRKQYSAEENIRMVERSSRPAKWTLDKIGVQRRTFYRWYDRYSSMAKTVLLIMRRIQAACGTKFQITSGLTSLIWPWTYQSYRRVSWLSASQTPKVILCQKARHIGF